MIQLNFLAENHEVYSNAYQLHGKQRGIMMADYDVKYFPRKGELNPTSRPPTECRLSFSGGTSSGFSGAKED